METGRGSDSDLRGIAHWLQRVTDSNRCYLPVQKQQVVASVLRAFPEEFAAHIESGTCPRPRQLSFPKLTDLVDGTAIYDESIWRKRPDWTFDPFCM